MTRVVGAFLSAPFLVLLVGAFSTGTQDGFLVAVMIAYPIALVFGVPLFFLFRWRGWLRWWQATIGGAVCAAPFVLLYVLGANPMHVEKYGASNSMVLFGYGALIGLVFWAIGLAGNSALTAGSSGRSQASAAEPGR
jgi:asparagine N-glycosylation enzyme membrane subunit Stt3